MSLGVLELFRLSTTLVISMLCTFWICAAHCCCSCVLSLLPIVSRMSLKQLIAQRHVETSFGCEIAITMYDKKSFYGESTRQHQRPTM